MRLHVRQADAFALCDPGKRADLVEHHVFHVLRRHSHLAAAESHEVGETWVCADRHAGLASETNGSPHHPGIAAVVAAGDVRGCDAAHHRFVGANGVGAKRLAEIAIQIDRRHGSEFNQDACRGHDGNQ